MPPQGVLGFLAGVLVWIGDGIVLEFAHHGIGHVVGRLGPDINDLIVFSVRVMMPSRYCCSMSSTSA
jgi:hypothetical protein